jgi:hypothetical protein
MQRDQSFEADDRFMFAIDPGPLTPLRDGSPATPLTARTPGRPPGWPGEPTHRNPRAGVVITPGRRTVLPQRGARWAGGPPSPRGPPWAARRNATCPVPAPRRGGPASRPVPSAP